MNQDRRVKRALVLLALGLQCWLAVGAEPTDDMRRAASMLASVERALAQDDANRLAQKQAAQRASVRMTTTAINTLSDVTVIDLLCDARFYQSSTYSPDGFHPSDAGYAIMAGEIVSAIRSTSYPAPRASCSQMTLY